MSDYGFSVGMTMAVLMTGTIGVNLTTNTVEVGTTKVKIGLMVIISSGGVLLGVLVVVGGA